MMEQKIESIGTKVARHSFLPAKRQDCHGGTIINIITAIIFFGLIALGVLWVIKNVGEAGQQYTDGMIKTQNKAIGVKCQMNMRTIAQNIQIYALSNESFPPSLEALIEFSGSTQLFQCPDPDGSKYVYIPGQNNNMPPTNILLYETNPVHNDRCCVLRLNRQIELLSPEELKQAVAQTLAGLRK
jgi:archaellum component FlaF (FlaF/FlaG flagellin family)